jgi:hypothetical protein
MPGLELPRRGIWPGHSRDLMVVAEPVGEVRDCSDISGAASAA